MKKICLTLISTILFSTACAMAGGFGAGIKVGTLGLGADVTVGLHEQLNLRANGNYLNFDYDRDIDNIEYNLDLDFASGMLLLDWHPFSNGFRISGGAVFNDSSMAVQGTPTEPEEIGDNTYPPELIGTIRGKVEFEDVAAYVGIGFGNVVGEDQSLSFIFDLGIVFQSYELELSNDGAISQYPPFQADLAKEEAKIQEDLDGYKVYPVIAFGIAYKF